MKSTYSNRYDAFLARLRALRKDAGVSQIELAKRLEKTQSYISKVEQSQRRLDLVELVEWLEALQLPVEPTTLHLVESLELTKPIPTRRRLKLPK